MIRGSLNRAAVIAAAADLADRDGLAAVTVSAVARDLGIRPASLYSHVRDLAELLDLVHELALNELADAVALGTAGRSGRSALAGLAEAHRRYAWQGAGRWAALQRPATPATAASAGASRLARLTLAVLAGYGLTDDELVHATRFFGATVNGFLSLQRNGGYDHRTPSTDLSWERTLSAVDTALTHWPSSGTREGRTTS